MNTEPLQRKRKKHVERDTRQAEYRKRHCVPTVHLGCPDLDDPRLKEFVGQLHGEPPVLIHVTPVQDARIARCWENCKRFRRNDEDIVRGYRLLSFEDFWWVAEPHWVLRGPDGWRDVTPHTLSPYPFVPSQDVAVATIKQGVEYILVENPNVHKAISLMRKVEEYAYDALIHGDSNAIRNVAILLHQVKTLLALE